MFPIRDHNPSERTPYVTIALIVVNLAVFLAGLATIRSQHDAYEFYYRFAMIPALISDGQGYGTLFTSMFLHAGWLHLAGNMLFLWIFGDNLEDQLGHVGFVAFYVVAGVGAGLAQYAVDPGSPVPTVGASGAIAGVMGGYLLLFPRARVDVLLFLVVFVRIFAVPAWIVLVLWFGVQIVSGVGSDPTTGGVAHWAHVGGFVLGLILIVPLWLRRGASGYWAKTGARPPHPAARYPLMRSNVPRVPRR
jgi:membrane associated rhomboid family serine protease